VKDERNIFKTKKEITSVKSTKTLKTLKKRRWKIKAWLLNSGHKQTQSKAFIQKKKLSFSLHFKYKWCFFTDNFFKRGTNLAQPNLISHIRYRLNEHFVKEFLLWRYWEIKPLMFFEIKKREILWEIQIYSFLKNGHIFRKMT